MLKVKVILIYFLWSQAIFAFDSLRSGQNWEQINSQNGHFIFPKEASMEARVLTSYWKTSLSLSRQTLDFTATVDPITFVINNTTGFANGFATVLPFYSELFTFPSNLGTSSAWLSTLLTHEGHHLVQFLKLQQTVGQKLWYLLGGGYGWGLMMGAYVPAWFLEGNAVVQESLYNHSGRGQHPIFTIGLRAKELYGKRDSYYKTYLNHDFLPLNQTYYDLGFILSSYVQFTYPINTWGKILSSINRYVFFPNFNLALGNYTGLSIRELYHQSLDFYKKKWKKQIKDLPTDSTIKVLVSSNDRKKWNAFLQPSFLEDGSLLSLSIGNMIPPELIYINFFFKPPKYESLLQMPSSLLLKASRTAQQTISTGGMKVAWIEKIPHLYEEKQIFSDIWVYDFEENFKTRLTKNSRYVSSSLSPDGRQLVAFYKGYDGKGQLHFYDVESKKITKKVSLPFGCNIYDITWSSGRDKIAFTSILGSTGVGIQEYNLDKNLFEYLIKPLKGLAIRNIQYWKNYLIFQSDISGLDQIHAMNLKSKQWYQITHRTLGAFYPVINSKTNKLIFSDYGINGFSLFSLPIDTTSWKIFNQRDTLNFNSKQTKPFRKKTNILQHILDKYPKQQRESSFSEDIKIQAFATSFVHLFEINFWQFTFINREYGGLISFRDYLSTTEIQFEYLKTNKRHVFRNSLKYTNYFPDFFIQSLFYTKKNQNFTLDDPKFKVGIDLPFNFSKRQIYEQTLRFRQSWYYVSFKENIKFDLGFSYMWKKQKKTKLSFLPLEIRISPRWQQSLASFNTKEYLFDVLLTVPFFETQGVTFLGCHSTNVFFNHCLGKFSLQTNKKKRNIYSLAYGFNLFYPNFNVSFIYYLKRLDFNFFVEYSKVFVTEKKDERKLLLGSEILFINHFLSNIIPVEIVCRYGLEVYSRLKNHYYISFDIKVEY